MGIEVAIAMAVMSAVNTMHTAGKEAKAVTKQAQLDAKNKAISTKAKAAMQKTSFLSSGFTLEGTPMNVLDSTFTTGQQDISQIISNANTKSKNIISSARSKALNDLAGTAMGAYAGGNIAPQAASYLPESTLYSMNSMGMGNLSYEALELKDMRY